MTGLRTLILLCMAACCTHAAAQVLHRAGPQSAEDLLALTITQRNNDGYWMAVDVLNMNTGEVVLTGKGLPPDRPYVVGRFPKGTAFRIHPGKIVFQDAPKFLITDCEFYTVTLVKPSTNVELDYYVSDFYDPPHYSCSVSQSLSIQQAVDPFEYL